MIPPTEPKLYESIVILIRYKRLIFSNFQLKFPPALAGVNLKVQYFILVLLYHIKTKQKIKTTIGTKEHKYKRKRTQ